MRDTGRMIPWGDHMVAKENKNPVGWDETYGNLRWMVEESLTWPEEKIGKLNRWLGFVQGVLWMADDHQNISIDDLREINLGPEEPS